MAHTSADWWDIRGPFQHAEGTFDAHLTHWAGTPIATGRNFDADGKLKSKNLTIMTKDQATAAVKALSNGPADVLSVDERPYQDSPSPPFTTSTLQQEANRRFKWAAKKTMSAAQRLYENGWITYMRTDSTNLVESGHCGRAGADSKRVRRCVHAGQPSGLQGQGEECAGGPRGHPAGRRAVPNAQGGQEPLGSDESRLYELIWKRTVGCQMSNARGRTITVRVKAGEGQFEAKGKTIEFAGYRLAYVADHDDPEAAAADAEKILPPVKADDALTAGDLEAKGHATKPPPRLTEASLVKEMEERGIGRPSTYASIIETIINREYVFKKGSALVPTWTAFAVTRLLESEQFKWLVEYEFTAEMEVKLDDIAVGDGNRNDYLSTFWDALQQALESGGDNIDPRHVCTIPIGEVASDTAKKLGVEAETPVVVRVGKYGPFLQAGERTANLPDELAPDELSVDKAIELLQGPKALGQDPETGMDVYLANGRFGWYVQLGTNDETEKPKRKSVPRGLKPRPGRLRGRSRAARLAA